MREISPLIVLKLVGYTLQRIDFKSVREFQSNVEPRSSFGITWKILERLGIVWNDLEYLGNGILIPFLIPPILFLIPHPLIHAFQGELEVRKYQKSPLRNYRKSHLSAKKSNVVMTKNIFFAKKSPKYLAVSKKVTTFAPAIQKEY